MNVLTISGRTTKLATLKQNTKMSVATFSIAFSDGKNEDGTNKSSFIDCIAFGKTADFIVQKVPKGTLVGITGRISIETWEKDGKKNQKLILNVNTFDVFAYPEPKQEPKQEPKPTSFTRDDVMREQPPLKEDELYNPEDFEDLPF